jgi:hypothetical protein
MSELEEESLWAPDVCVVGLGPTGVKTVQRIETSTSAQIYTDSEPANVEASDFLFLCGDLSEPGVSDQVSALIEDRSEVCTLFFADGCTDEPETFVEDINLLCPVPLAGKKERYLISSTIADLFECMLKPTLHELGKGEIAVTAGEHRVAELFIDHLGNTQQLYDLTPGIQTSSIDAILMYFCYDDNYPVTWVSTKLENYDIPTNTSFFYDPRTHNRYQDRGHIKRIITSKSSREYRAKILKDEYMPRTTAEQ